MSKKLLIVLSSVRESRLADKVLDEVQKELKSYEDFEVSIADFKKTPLPFFDSAQTTSSPDFKAVDPHVQNWISQVTHADAVLILAAEYNHSYTAAIKNAIDWTPAGIWENKPVSFVGYGWVGGSRATSNLRNLLTGFIQATPTEMEGNLRFNQEIGLDGSVLDAEATSAAIKTALDALK